MIQYRIGKHIFIIPNGIFLTSSLITQEEKTSGENIKKLIFHINRKIYFLPHII